MPTQTAGYSSGWAYSRVVCIWLPVYSLVTFETDGNNYLLDSHALSVVAFVR